MSKDINTATTNNNTTLNRELSTFQKYSALLGRSISNYHELYGQETTFSDGTKIKAFPHLVFNDEDAINPIAYNDSFGSDQKDLVKAMGKRRIAISIKHHAASPEVDSLEVMKLQCSHAQLVVRSNEKVVTLNNPQDYQSGLFGNDEYPMIFFTLDFGPNVSEELEVEIEKNIITWAVLLNTFTHFPSGYNGGDPLTAKSVNEAHSFADQVLRAFENDENAKQFLLSDENKLYCAEMVYMSLLLGTTYPLTENFLKNSTYVNLQKAFSAETFKSLNRNSHLKEISIDLPIANYQGISSLQQEKIVNGLSDSLPIRPMLVSDMLTNFIKYMVPRKINGENVGKYQVELLDSCHAFLKTFLPKQVLNNPNSELSRAIEDVRKVLLMNHENYDSFKDDLKKSLDIVDFQVSLLSTSQNMFIPPHTFLVRALEKKCENRVRGIIGIDYLGHGIHSTLLKKEF